MHKLFYVPDEDLLFDYCPDCKDELETLAILSKSYDWSYFL